MKVSATTILLLFFVIENINAGRGLKISGSKQIDILHKHFEEELNSIAEKTFQEMDDLFSLSFVEINYREQITIILDKQLKNITADAKKKGTPAALQCLEYAREEFKNISDRGYDDVSTFVKSSSNGVIANLYCQPIYSRVFNEALDVSRLAGTCIEDA